MSLDWIKDLAVPLVSGIGGAIAGAGVSYLASSRLAKSASDEVLRRDQNARIDQDRRAAHQVYVKLHSIANGLGSFQKQISEMIAKAEVLGKTKMPLYQRLSGFVGIDREPSIEFSAEELAIYISAKQPAYVDDLLLLSRRHAACVTSLGTFAKLKAELSLETARLGTTSRDAETGFSTTQMRLPPEFANYVKYKQDELDIFANSMCQLLAEYSAFAFDVAGRFEQVTKSFIAGPIPGFALVGKDEFEISP